MCVINVNGRIIIQNNKPVIYRKDYKELNYKVKYIFLYFNILSWDKVKVTSFMFISSSNTLQQDDLILNGEDLNTLHIKFNNVSLSSTQDYLLSEHALTIKYEVINNLKNVSYEKNFNKEFFSIFSFLNKDNFLNDLKASNLFLLESKVIINPQNNTQLMGIYRSQDYLCSQCEPEGFRRITWYIDRSDNMAKWSVAIEASKINFPILLSNGNKVNNKSLPNKRHLVVFNDPFNKPSYLFALVAGKFECLHETYTTFISNKKIELYIYTNKKDISKAHYAMLSLKKAMLWDETTYGLEYDLNVFSIVAVKDFNFGAMENKSLNIFNEMYILANHNITTDSEFIKIESIIAHEYFHNYTGNKVTCRDWFQLTLKEGLTVFREQKFSETQHFESIIRINNVDLLKNKQFPEDSSPLAHPIRPESYIEIDNFYTKTVYEKGAEVVRMIQTIIGENNFKKGLKLFLTTYNGQACTCEDFISSMEKASNVSLEQFKKWYNTKGTPIVDVKTEFNNIDNTFSIKLKQNLNNDCVLLIPLKIALIDEYSGEYIKLNSTEKLNNIKLINNNESIFFLSKEEQTCVFSNIKSKPVLSINRDFSAPIIINSNLTNEELNTLILYDTNGYIKYESAKKYLTNIVLKIIDLFTQLPNNLIEEKLLDITEINNFIHNNENLIKNTFLSFKKLFNNISNNLENYSNILLISYILKIHSFEDISKSFSKTLPLYQIYNSLNILKVMLAHTLEKELLYTYNILKNIPDDFSKENYSKRALKNTILSLLVSLEKEDYFTLVEDHYYSSTNMTNKIAALNSIKNYTQLKIRNQLFNNFITSYKAEATVVNKYLALVALTINNKVIDNIKEIIKNKEIFSYSNPNNVSHLLGSFAFSNLFCFHSKNGDGYEFIMDAILVLDKINPSVAAHLATAFSQLYKYDSNKQKLMLLCINKTLSSVCLSKGTYEVLNKIVEFKNES